MGPGWFSCACRIAARAGGMRGQQANERLRHPGPKDDVPGSGASTHQELARCESALELEPLILVDPQQLRIASGGKEVLFDDGDRPLKERRQRRCSNRSCHRCERPPRPGVPGPAEEPFREIHDGNVNFAARARLPNTADHVAGRFENVSCERSMRGSVLAAQPVGHEPSRHRIDQRPERIDRTHGVSEGAVIERRSRPVPRLHVVEQQAPPIPLERGPRRRDTGIDPARIVGLHRPREPRASHRRSSHWPPWPERPRLRALDRRGVLDAPSVPVPAPQGGPRPAPASGWLPPNATGHRLSRP